MMHGISVAMIVENEAEFINQCIESVNGFADEIVVLLDHKSNDGTREKLYKYAEIHVFDNVYEGEIHFSNARNKSLKKCQYEWTFILDGDEIVEGDPKEIRKHILNSPLDRMFTIPVKQQVGKTVFGTLSQPRCFPTRKSVEYKGEVHNQPDFDPKILHYDIHLPAQIRHEGFGSKSKRERREKRTIKMIEVVREKIDKTGGSINDFYNMTKMLQVVNKIDEAVQYGKYGMGLFVKLPPEEQNKNNRFLISFVLAKMAIGDWTDCESILKYHINITGETVDNSFLLFTIYYRNGKMISAFMSILKYFEMFDIEKLNPVNMQAMQLYEPFMKEKLFWLKYFIDNRFCM